MREKAEALSEDFSEKEFTEFYESLSPWEMACLFLAVIWDAIKTIFYGEKR